MKHFFITVLLCTTLVGCGSLAAGMLNRGYIEEDNSQYVAHKLVDVKQLDITKDQETKIEGVYLDEITALKENAKREKTKEISNKASLNNIRFEWYKTQKRLLSILSEDQVIEARNKNIISYSEAEMQKEEKKLMRMGYNLSFD